MIWSVVSKSEMYGVGSNPVFRFYREAIGKENVRLAVVDETDALDFVAEDDIVLLRTASERLISTIGKKRVKSTAERFSAYELTKDKVALAECMNVNGVLVPRQYHIPEISDGRVYFVKPRFGSDSVGITPDCICRTKEEVLRQVSRINEELDTDAIIEDFIEGFDCTVACINCDRLLTYAVKVECEETGSIQTRDYKAGFMEGLMECCSALHDDEIERITKNIFRVLGLRSHMRIDFRKGIDGRYYLIDVNLLPGLGPFGYLAKCAMICADLSYKSILGQVISTAAI